MEPEQYFPPGAEIEPGFSVKDTNLEALKAKRYN